MQNIKDAINLILELEKDSTGQIHPSNDLVLNLLVEDKPLEKIKAHFYDENESSKMKKGSEGYVKSLLELANFRADVLVKHYENDEKKIHVLNEFKIIVNNLVSDLT